MKCRHAEAHVLPGACGRLRFALRALQAAYNDNKNWKD